MTINDFVKNRLYDVNFCCEYDEDEDYYIEPDDDEIYEEVKSTLEFILDDVGVEYNNIVDFDFRIVGDGFWDDDLLEYKVKYSNIVLN